jgi:NAD(P)-dependent dehydrogenase (short-subunit alcohol dehydrogenase family)
VKFEGKVVLITGANRGLGARLVRSALDAGSRKVYGSARNPATVGADVTADSRVEPLVLDITDQSSVDAAAAVAHDVEILVNNAGVLGFGSLLDGDLDVFQRDLSTNYLGTLRVTRAFVPTLARNAPSAVVNVLTLVALAPMGPMSGYCASKAAAHSMTQALRAEVKDRGIDVFGAYPGGIDTDMLAGVEAPKARPNEVAAGIVAGVEAGETVIWPDDVSAGAGAVYLVDPLRLEELLAG